jgi:hypothetical protein
MGARKLGERLRRRRFRRSSILHGVKDKVELSSLWTDAKQLIYILLMREYYRHEVHL